MANLNDFYRGDDRNYNLIFVDEDDAALDITGWTIFITVKEKLTDADDDAKIKAVGTITDAAGGLASFTFTAAQTYDLDGNYHYDIQIKKADGKIFTVTSGKVKVKKDTTRRTTNEWWY